MLYTVKNYKKEMITMKNSKLTRSLSFILSVVLIAAIALFTVGCNDDQNNDLGGQGTAKTIENGAVYGEGEKSFTFTVVDGEGNEVSCEVRTDKTVVGDALLELGLISKNINGITAECDVNGTY